MESISNSSLIDSGRNNRVSNRIHSEERVHPPDNESHANLRSSFLQINDEEEPVPDTKISIFRGEEEWARYFANPSQ
jgi:hypothetical protein